tara:strand:- start:1143 stop:2462 length:1320 start_codon:yes stop_codon:yes gene_type:complete
MGKQKLKQTHGQFLSPQQIQFLALLQSSIVSLEKKIERELEDNPALEEEEDLEEHQNPQYTHYNNSSFEDLQVIDRNESLREHLQKQLVGLNLNDTSLYLVKYLINSLDDNGFLNRDLYSISSDLLINNNKPVSEEFLKEMLHILQNLEPIGVGTKNLQESLLLQLKKLYKKEKIAIKIISKYYTAFSNKNYNLLIKELNLSEKKLKQVYNLIEGLNPIPAAGFSNVGYTTKYMYPDFKITMDNNSLELQINAGRVKRLKLSSFYSKLLSETTDLKTKHFLSKKIEKAKWFKESIEKRYKTLKTVMLAIVKIQKKYFISGLESDLRPMKLADVAEMVNMDISTISRVSNSKFVETHFGTFKLKELFSEAYRKDDGTIISTKKIKEKLKEIINGENKKNPFTDEKLADLLGKEEYHIARRTVAKYREQIGVEIARLRKKL